MRPRALKRRLRAYEERTGKAVSFRATPRGRLLTTLALSRLALGVDESHAPTLNELVAELDTRLRQARRDINALGARVAKMAKTLFPRNGAVRMVKDGDREPR